MGNAVPRQKDFDEDLADKYRGCLVAGLVGDCHGRVFEFHVSEPMDAFTSKVTIYFDNRRNGVRDDLKPYTDDTAMATVLAKSLIKRKKIDIKHLANGFVQEYEKCPTRGYALSMTTLFDRLHEKTDADILQPARERYKGEGSYGNGAAMRIAPVSLFYHSDEQSAIQASHDQALISHSHYNGYNGAILLNFAIQQALSIPSSDAIDQHRFLEELRRKMAKIESTRENPEERLFSLQLDKIKQFIEREEAPPLKEVAKELGNEIIAHRSVPAAIYCFLAGQDPSRSIQVENTIERIIEYAICLGGDTDTIGCMAGYIGGAHLGLRHIPSYLQTSSENCDKTIELANRLFQVCR